MTALPQTREKMSRCRGFALPMTVMAIAGMMLLLVGLLSVLSLERKTARSYSDATRAEMAVESGLADAIATLGPIAGRDDSLVFRFDDPDQPVIAAEGNQPSREQFFTFGAMFDGQAGNWRVLPFVSGLMEYRAGSRAIDATQLAARIRGANTQSLVSLNRYDRQVPRGAWVNVPSPGSPFTMRYAWWVEDLSGRLDGVNAATQPRNEALSPQEIQYYTLFNPAATTKPANGPQDRLVAQRMGLRTPAGTRLVLGEADAALVEPAITYQLPRSMRRVPLIPQGFGYPDAGMPARNLSELIEQRNVDAIAAHIDRNLPDFINRRGGFPATENYTKTIAASIIDYADADSDATIGAGYRGVDSYPFVNELFDRYEWASTDAANRTLTIRVSTFVELWNPSQQAISGRFRFTNVNRHEIIIPLVGTRVFGTATFPEQAIDIPPNGFVVRLCGTQDYTFPMGAFQPSELNFPSIDTTASTFELLWNGRLVDNARGGLQRTPGNLRAGASNRKWKGNGSPAHDHDLGQHGDPRASRYINTWVFANNYDANSNWGGRALKRGINPARSFREVSLLRWPDRGWNSTPGTAANSDAVLPTALNLPANQPSMAPAFIANRPLQSLVEMGHVFDPAQWRNIEVAPSAAVPSSNSGGGFTLAIGRPEYGAFDLEGRRAAQLLDLFALTPTPLDDLPRVNINTASREVLRCLVAGQSLTRDPQQGTVLPPSQTFVGDRFADAVIATRNRNPLRSLSDLNLIRLNPAQARSYTSPQANTEPFFGSRLQYTGSAAQPAESWDDAGREELFQRVSSLVTFQSKTFRVVVAGQVLNQTGAVMGRKMREYVVEISPARDANGAIVPGQPLQIRTLSQRNL
jgi:hypothetical protein